MVGRAVRIPSVQRLRYTEARHNQTSDISQAAFDPPAKILHSLTDRHIAEINGSRFGERRRELSHS